MDTNRSHDHDHDEASYSEDFEHDAESQESPISEEKVEIKVFKITVGSLTVQPKKIVKPILPIPTTKTGRTVSELSLFTKKGRPVKNQGGPGSNQGSGNVSGRSVSVKLNESRTSLARLGTHNLRRQPLAQEKLDPNDVPASASISSVSISRLSIQGNRSGYSRGAGSNIRRVIAHTSIKEKSYASAKYKTYNNPPVRGNNPPLKIGMGRSPGNVAQRVASAKRMTIMDLKSRVKLLQDEIEKLKKENRFLNHLHHREDNALKKWEEKDAELPRLLNQHKDEIRSLQEQLRKTQQHARDHNEKLAVRDKKILRLETELDKLRVLVHEEHLQDRHTVQQELEVTRMNLIGAEKRIREYMRHVDILEKNHRHQLAAQERKLIKVNTHTYELQQVVANLKLALRNKDRMLNYIQMRSSGRSLIRAFHAERIGNDDMLYGTSFSTDHTTRPYQPAPLMKSHSFDFGNSRSVTPSFDDKRGYDFLHNKRRSDEHKSTHNQQIKNHKDREDLSRSPSRRSHSLESLVGRRASTPAAKSNKERGMKKCRSVAHSDRIPDKEYRQKPEKCKSTPGKSILKKPQKSEDRLPFELSSDKVKRKSSKSSKYHEPSHVNNEASKASKQALEILNSKKSPKSSVKKSNLENTDSVELIYRGSSTGFRYEGPFMKASEDVKQKEDADNLDSPTSDKQSVRNNMSSTNTTTSSRSEILSNIDILSARIRESCVLIPPPEEKGNLPGNNAKSNGDKTHQGGVGPGGDNNSVSNLTSMLLSGSTVQPPPPLPREEMQASSSQFHHAGLLQPIQLYTYAHSNDFQPLSPKSQQSYISTSPRMQLNAFSLPSVNPSIQQQQQQQQQQAVQSSPFQLTQATAGPSTNISYMPANTDSCNQICSSSTQSNLTASEQQICQQIVDASTGIQYRSCLPQNYSHFNTVSVVSEQPQMFGTEFHQSSPQQIQSNSPRFPGEIPSYISFTTTPDMQVPQPTNITIIQTNSMYDQQITARSNASVSRSPQQPLFFTTSKANETSFPSVGFLNTKAAPDKEQTFPNPNSNSTKNNQPGYNPSYYVNLGSWK